MPPRRPAGGNLLNEPETWQVLDRVKDMADRYGLTLLPEIHAAYAEGSYATLAQKGYMTYDFFLPGLITTPWRAETAACRPAGPGNRWKRASVR